jgi:hypothetical protein
MRILRTISKIALFGTMTLSTAIAQEYDDLYFSKKDRVTKKVADLSTVTASAKPVFNYNETQPEQPSVSRYANPDYTGEVPADGSSSYSYYDENQFSNSLLMNTLASGNYTPRYRDYSNNNFNRNNWNSFAGMGMMGNAFMLSPWERYQMRSAMARGYDPFMMDPFMSNMYSPYGWNNSPSMSFGWNSMFGSSMMINMPLFGNPYSPFSAGLSMGFGWGMNSFSPWNNNFYCPPALSRTYVINNGVMNNGRVDPAYARQTRLASDRTATQIADRATRYQNRLANRQQVSSSRYNTSSNGNRSNTSYSRPFTGTPSRSNTRSTFSNPSNSRSTSVSPSRSSGSSSPSRSSSTGGSRRGGRGN